jgi:23S rRNA pseudouridine955/2504/2580 synthase
VRIPPVRTDEKEAARVPDAVVARIEEAIVQEEGDWLACDKPAGIAVHAGSGLGWGLIDALRQSRPGEDLELVHRLDRETSGLLLVARNRQALLYLQRQFAERETAKRYLALLDGVLPGPRLVVTEALGRQQVSGERMVVVDPEGKPAETVFSEVERYGDCVLAEVEPVTGRTHQIRVHAAHIGAPCAGDPKYSGRERQRYWRERGLERLFLHAHRLEFTDAAGERRLLSSPLPAELRRVLDGLESG